MVYALNTVKLEKRIVDSSQATIWSNNYFENRIKLGVYMLTVEKKYHKKCIVISAKKKTKNNKFTMEGGHEGLARELLQIFTNFFKHILFDWNLNTLMIWTEIHRKPNQF